MVVEVFDGAKLLDQLDGRLFTDLGDSGIIIRAIAHQRFHVDNLPRRNAEFFFYVGRSIVLGVGDPLMGNGDRGVVAGQLGQIAVPSND